MTFFASGEESGRYATCL